MFRAPMGGPKDDADKIFDTFITYIFDARTHARTYASGRQGAMRAFDTARHH